ncbi:MAG: hypothetical protein HY785_16000 [Oscillatoriophycideae cyanobacterium NC_groundwater_1537_Pr4_S-0.65um_50_18]|nr:hypothetical protein [Oscillatoriophycideae cyanobacterium NC_groundwater_1537_Pr4_S-0.65um_50_18]
MKAPVKLLSLTVWITVWLLLIGTTLVILGIFNQQLNWDIFSPQVEQILYGIFFSCIVLSAFGVAVTFVLGLKRIVEAVELLQQKGQLEHSLVAPKAQRLTYVGYMMGLFVAFSALVGALELADHRVQIHRSQVFKQIASEQVQKFGQRFSLPLSQFDRTTSTVPGSISEPLKALGSLSFVQNIVLYVPDPQDRSSLWRHSQYQTNANGKPIFERFLAAKEFETAIAQALRGDPKALDALNRQTRLTWYHILIDAQEQPLAVLKIEGNPNENFREYTSEPAYRQN